VRRGGVVLEKEVDTEKMAGGKRERIPKKKHKR
jgi:hypothetical protein